MSPMPRKSLQEHELQGTEPHYSTTKISHIAPGRPYPPKFLSDVAKNKFRSLVRVLAKRRVATSGDGEVITQYVCLWERWVEANQHVRDEGCIIEQTRATKTGELYTVQVPNPWLKIAQVTEKQLATLMTALGLTVSSRDKAKQTPLDKENDIAPGSVYDLYPELLLNVVPITRTPVAVDPKDMLADDEPRGETA